MRSKQSLKKTRAKQGEARTEYGETKKRVNLSLTLSAIAWLNSLAERLNLSRSDLIERITRLSSFNTELRVEIFTQLGLYQSYNDTTNKVLWGVNVIIKYDPFVRICAYEDKIHFGAYVTRAQMTENEQIDMDSWGWFNDNGAWAIKI